MQVFVEIEFNDGFQTEVYFGNTPFGVRMAQEYANLKIRNDDIKATKVVENNIVIFSPKKPVIQIFDFVKRQLPEYSFRPSKGGIEF